MRTGKYNTYVCVAVKMPEGLKDRIDELARTQQGNPLTRNGWIVRELARRAKWGVYEPIKGKKEVNNE